MIRSLVGLPLRLGARYAGVAAHATTQVAERAFGVVGLVSKAFGGPGQPDVDLDGRPHERGAGTRTAGRRPGAASRSEPASSADGPAAAADAPSPPARPRDYAPPPPAPPAPPRAEAAPHPPAPASPVPGPTETWSAPIPPDVGAPDHVSEEATLVDSVAEPGAEDGAGAQVHVAEPWDGYRKLKANEIIDRLSGASTAELATVDLFERAGRARQSVLAAVERELKRSSG